MPSSTDSDRMRAAVAHLAEASARLAEVLLARESLLGASAAHTAAAPATSGPGAMVDGAVLVAAPGAVRAPEGASKDSPGPSAVVFSAPSLRPRVLGLDESEARLLLANALAVLEHARPRIHSTRRPQLDAVAGQIRTALDGQRGRTRETGPPAPGSAAVAA